MRALSGREFARLVERHGWTFFESTVVITSTAELEASCGCQFRFTATDRSRLGSFAILPSWQSFRPASSISAMTRIDNTMLLSDAKKMSESIVKAL
jgi:hypothetical protein